MTQAQDYVIDTGHGQVAEGVWAIAVVELGTPSFVVPERPKYGSRYAVPTVPAKVVPAVPDRFIPTGQLITGAGL